MAIGIVNNMNALGFGGAKTRINILNVYYLGGDLIFYNNNLKNIIWL